MKREIAKVSIIGMGALGLLYGSHIAKNLGIEAVDFIMEEDRLKKYKDQKFYCNGEEMQFALTRDSEAEPADLLIVAVKYTGLEKALISMKRCIGPDTIILSVLNGISSERIIGMQYGMDKVIYTIAQGMDAMKFDNKLQYTRMGKLHVGIVDNGQQDKLNRVISFFDKINIPYEVEEDILHRLWSKFMLNVGVNQTCMVYNTNYAGTLVSGEPNRTMISAMREVIAVANAEGINLCESDINYYIDIIGTLNPEGTPSMGQDRINRKPSEVELFSGTVIQLAKKHKIYVPVNEFLYRRVKEIEKEYL
ncbi:ketopantoate reductase family protein [Lachnospiraceae bacterium MD1]|uniref:2-dehydropantoate 2-reductase n=2 Tax=Variimorphobacter saccharofermentans TaxID=2755051 RepID=A0A839K3Z9_9FIRM|nr:ketopantoate reductase family protein [Variimorphobacter saccharofermentans]